MEKVKLDILNLKDVKGFILSPSNIFWKQKSGNLVLLSAKFDFLNLELIEKLSNAKHELLIENHIDLPIQEEFLEYFKNHHAEIIVNKKKRWRHKLLMIFSSKMCNDKISQLELNQLGWKIFSKVDRVTAKRLVDIDIDLFKRSMSLATSYTLCAFILGCYCESFLTNLYTDTIVSSMNFNKTIPISSIKEQLEKMRIKKSWDADDRQLLKNIYSLNDENEILNGERYDGTGIKEINQYEMNDLEIVFIALNEHFSFTGNLGVNIFHDIKHSDFKCDDKILTALKRYLSTDKKLLLSEAVGDFS